MKLEYSELFSIYESKIETVLLDFCKKEGIENPNDFYTTCANIVAEDEKAIRLLQMLIAGSDFKKFGIFSFHTPLLIPPYEC
jgi:hypothetical protein